MAAYFLTTTPNALLKAFKKAIDEGHIVTWSYDNQGDFTHTVSQWKNLAWLRPSVQSDRLVFNIIKPQNTAISKEVYAIYHGRMIEAMLAHFDNTFTDGVATAAPDGNDLVA